DAEFKPFWSASQPQENQSKPVRKSAQGKEPASAGAAATAKDAQAKPASRPGPAETATATRPAGKAAARPAPASLNPAKPAPLSGTRTTAGKPAPLSAAKGAARPAGRAARPGAEAHKPHHGSGAAKDAAHIPKLHSGQTVELNIASTNNDGFGVAMSEGQRVLVAGGLPGEQLVARVTYVGRREAFANTIKCLKCSPDRQPAPACHMGRCCDGCGLMQMRYPAQLVWKKSLVTRELRRYASLAEVEVHD